MKIQKRLLLSILPVVFVTAMAVASAAILLSTNTIEQQVKDNAQLLSRSYSNQLNAKIVQLKRMSIDVAAAIVTAVNVETVLIDARKRSPEINRLMYTSLDGKIKDMAPYTSKIRNENYLDNPLWKKAIRTLKPVISDPIDYLGKKVVFIYTPVKIDYVTNKTAEVIGVMVIAINYDFIFSEFNQVLYGKTGEVFIVNSDGYYVGHKNPDNIMNINISDLKSTSDINEIIIAMKSFRTGLATFYNGGTKKFVSFAGVSEANWSLAISGSYKEFTTQINPLITISATILFAALIFASFFIFFIVKGVISPISILTDMAGKITEGDMSLRSNLTTGNEMGILSRAFDGMVDRLEDYNKTLEMDVLERTQELTAANEELRTMNDSMEAMNEELTSTNESLDNKNREMEAMNEELQATNEALDQNARDLESMNEELKVTNEALDQNAREMEAMNEELKVTNEALDDKNREMEAMNQELSVTVEELDQSNRQLEITKNALWGEMELAQKLQTVLLPEEPRIDGFEISAFMSTTDSVGGDYYDVINVDGKDWFLIGDVSGHGVTAGLIMMMVQTSIHIALSQMPDVKPSDLLTTINKIVHSNISKLGVNRYMTLTVFACLDDDKFSFAGAHLPVIIYRKSTKKLEMIETPGTWIGLIDDVDELNSNNEFSLDDGDVVLLYTDGISEAVTKEGKQFTQKSLADLFMENVELEAKKICNSIKRVSESLILDDDVTVMVLKKVSK